MRIAVSSIVLNGKPFLNSWYDQALYITEDPDLIYISEGACSTKDQYNYGLKPGLFCDKNGHSIDGTLENLKNKNLNLFTKNELWNGKLQMFKAQEKKYKNFDFIWEIDIDEFYHKRDIDKIKEYLRSLKEPLKKMLVHGYHFWGDYTTAIEAPPGAWGHFEAERIFSWNKNSEWTNHRPPTVKNNGKVVHSSKKMNIKMFHYSYCARKQIEFKAEYYKSHYPQKRKCFEALLKSKNEYLKSVKLLSPHAKLISIPKEKHPIWTKNKLDKWEKV